MVTTLGFTILSQGQEIVNQAPQFLDSPIYLLERLQGFLAKLNFRVDFQAIEDGIRNQVLSFIGSGLVNIPGFLFNFIDLILIAVVAFFMLLDGHRVWNFILKLFPENLRDKITKEVPPRCSNWRSAEAKRVIPILYEDALN
ncbi:hypothetical protein DSM107003_26130 [Trichormus variabilis SAG 1403-4b]|uniref:Uncharacterized protein n=1 Tax=Trichormus variabilis SAG 1403-4b TaxID=447716 RepID=A0A433UQ39_ANAVA|nr:AI-2E family transporter [Trichormus variabilis]RUS95951.1 hypothetical protein DSM107003_26130 [Trichormus variabilis SAG 1403-4b]